MRQDNHSPSFFVVKRKIFFKKRHSLSSPKAANIHNRW